MMPVRAVCFDLFSTLVDVALVPESVGRFTADILGIDRKEWHDACFGSFHNIREPVDAFENLLNIARSINPDISVELVMNAVTERQARFDYALLNVESVVLETLQAIRAKGLRLGLISNASSSEVQAWFGSPLADLFDVVSFSFECGSIKPESRIYTGVLEKLGLQAEQCLFVGDGSSNEHFGAYDVGMKPVLISNYLDQKEFESRLEKYSAVLEGSVRDIDELINIYLK